MIYKTDVCILLTVYEKDNVDFLKISINSLIKQTYKNLHIFIGVDGPISSQVDNLLFLYNLCDNVSIIRFARNRGLACVLNDLIEICTSQGYFYFARMDADDIALPRRIEKQVDFLERHPEVDVVGGTIMEIDENSTFNGKIIYYPLTQEKCIKYFRYRDPLAHPAVMFRRRFFDKTGGYRNDYRKNQDTMLWFDGFQNGCTFANIVDPVLLFRITPDFYKVRRGGYTRAKRMLKDRFIINKMLNYDWTAYAFSFFMFFITIMPPIFKRLLYKIR